MNAASIDLIFTWLRAGGLAQAAVGASLRQWSGVPVMTTFVFVPLPMHRKSKKLLAQLYSKPTYTLPFLMLTAGYAPSFKQLCLPGPATVKYGLPTKRWPRNRVVLTSGVPCSHTGWAGVPPAGPMPPERVPRSHTDMSMGGPCLKLTGKSV